MIRFLAILSGCLLLAVIILGVICGIQGSVISGKVKKEYRISDYKTESKNKLKLNKKYIELLNKIDTKDFEKEYEKYKFDPIWYSNNQTQFDNMPILIYNYNELKNETDIKIFKLKIDFYIYDLYNQIFFKCNYYDLRGEK